MYSWFICCISLRCTAKQFRYNHTHTHTHVSILFQILFPFRLPQNIKPSSSQCLNNQPRQHIKKQRHYFANKGLSSQGYAFSGDHVQMWELDYKESWVPNNWCFWTVVLEKTLRVPWTARRSNQSILKEISSSVHWKNWCWSWNSSPLATWCELLTHLKRPWCWKRLKAGGEGDNRG